MALTEDEKSKLISTENDLKNQTIFFPLIALILFILIVISVYFYSTVEGWDVLDSLYFVIVTMATVGYGDYTPTNDIAKIYTIFLIIFGIATFTTFITQLLKRQGLRQIQKQLSGDKKLINKEIKKVKEKV